MRQTCPRADVLRGDQKAVAKQELNRQLSVMDMDERCLQSRLISFVAFCSNTRSICVDLRETNDVK
jgi:hypothetical protein